MSLYIKGLDMPKEGVWYNIMITSNGKGFVDVVSNDNVLTKTEPIQAAEIPTPHGRLIDEDNIDYDDFWYREGQGFTIAVCQGAQRIIKEQPTILKAEVE